MSKVLARGGGGGGGGPELLSLAGLRADGRRPSELRKIRCRLGCLPDSDGSAYLEQGYTRVVVSVNGPHEARASSRVRNAAAGNQERMTLSCECNVATFAGGERRRQRRGGDRVTTELAVLVRQTFESVILLQQYPRSQVDISVQVLQVDGGMREAAINATSIALLNAGVPMRDVICACSVMHNGDVCFVDGNALEMGAAHGAQLNLALSITSGRVSLMQLESRVSSQEQLEKMMASASDGCAQVYEVIKREVRRHTLELLDARGSSSL